MHLWTIEDANDGDVLACNEEILLFKSYSVQGRISLYCWYNGHTNNFHSKEVVDILMTTRNKICPATKEQRDLLFQKMKEEKELKKIEQKSATMSLDEAIEHCKEKSCGNNACALEHKQLENWLTELKELKEQKPAWSEEDEKMLNDAIGAVGAADYYTYDDKQEIETWLKSLKDRYTWKPSEEQMDALQYVCRNLNPPLSDKLGWNSLKTLELMFEQLKKLKE